MNFHLQSKNYSILIALILLIALSFGLYTDWINLPPSYIHQWAQSDWYSIAMCYAKDDIPFSLPRTYAIKTLFGNPNLWGEGNTRADFPIHAYISGTLMHYTDTYQPFIYRSYTLIFSITGLIVLFKLIYSASNSLIWAVCCMLMVFTNPIYAYYQVSFLPVVPSFACYIISLFFFYHYLKERKDSLVYLSILFITFAELSRPSFAIYWFALLVVYVFDCYKNHKFKYLHFLAFGVSLILQLSSYFYNKFLSDKYGSMFLNHSLPAKSLSEYFELFSRSIQNWRYDYLTHSQTVILVILIIILAIVLLSKKELLKTNQTLGLLLLISLAGALCFTFLMAQQFPDHDYYVIDCLLPVMVLFFLFFSKIISKDIITSPLFLGILTVCIFFNISESKSKLTARKNPSFENIYENVRLKYVGSAKYLDELNISKTAKMLVLNSYTYNVPLLEMDRKGYPILSSDPIDIIEALNYPYDFAVIRNEDIAFIMSVYPPITNQFQKIGTNNLITVYKKVSNSNILKFFNTKTSEIIIKDSTDFDNKIKTNIWNVKKENFSDKLSFSKPLSLKVDSFDFVGPKVQLLNNQLPQNCKSLNIIFIAKVIFPETIKKIKLAYEIHYSNSKTFEFTDIQLEKQSGSIWQNASCSANLKIKDNKT